MPREKVGSNGSSRFVTMTQCCRHYIGIPLAYPNCITVGWVGNLAMILLNLIESYWILLNPIEFYWILFESHWHILMSRTTSLMQFVQLICGRIATVKQATFLTVSEQSSIVCFLLVRNSLRIWHYREDFGTNALQELYSLLCKCILHALYVLTCTL